MAVIRDSAFGVALSGSYIQIADDFAMLDAPKLKFNFTISFLYTDMLISRGTEAGNDEPYEISFGVKQITRPAPNIIYEDVNFYNFMTKVATKVDFGVTSVTLYDDVNNKAHGIFKNYMEAVSPISRVNRDQATSLDRYGQSNTSSLGPLDDNARHGPIKSIRVNHITNHKGRKVIYDYINPKIQNVTLDELDMSQSDVNTLTFTFLYDAVNITEQKSSNSDIDFYTAEDFGRPKQFGAAAPVAQQTVNLAQAANVPAIANQIRNQINIDGIPAQILREQLLRLGVDTIGLEGIAIRRILRQIVDI